MLAFQVAQDLADPEDTHADGNEVQTVIEFGNIKNITRRAALHIGADRAEDQSEDDHCKCLQQRPAGKRNRSDETQHHQRKIFRRPEIQRYGCQRRCGNSKKDGCHCTCEKRTECRRSKRSTGSAVARHLIPVDCSNNRGAFARQIDQDRRCRATILRTVEDASQHDQCRFRRQAESDRQQHGDRRRRP
ncbi:hypothetical protein D3C87_1626580 [compost metagenome]